MLAARFKDGSWAQISTCLPHCGQRQGGRPRARICVDLLTVLLLPPKLHETVWEPRDERLDQKEIRIP